MKSPPLLIFEKRLTSENELGGVVFEISTYLESPSLILFSGDLGAGKTTTVRHLCEFYGVRGVQSPTYAVHQRYTGKNKMIDHFDLYRLQTEEELVSTGFWDLLQDQNSLLLIEWFERIADRSWLEFESEKRKIFGLKITLDKTGRVFQFFKLN